ncbi:hypothetical protein D3C78_18970 [compost metagenome]
MFKAKYLGTKSFFVNEVGAKNVSVYSLESADVEKEQIAHVIGVFDLSYSMSGSMKSLRTKAIEWLNSLKSNTYASVIVYSGHGESKVILQAVKCDPISLKMANAEKVINEQFSPIGVTVISEPLEKSIELVQASAEICDYHGVVLFTDGCLVPSRWNAAKEAELCYEVARSCAKLGVSLNAIGFGHYYDRQFLSELIESANTGILAHAETMDELGLTFADISYNLSGGIAVNLNVRAGDNNRVIIPTSTNVVTGEFAVRSLPREGKYVFAVIHDGAETPEVTIQGELDAVVIPSENATLVIDQAAFDTSILALAAYYAKGLDVDSAEFVVRQLGDVALAESLTNAYSFKESGEALQNILRYVNDDSIRFANGRKEAAAPKPEGLCTLDLVRKLTAEEGNELLWKVNTPYHSISPRVQTVEDNIKFVRDEEAVVKVNDVVVASDKLNIGIKVTIPGEVVDEVSGLRMKAITFRDRNIAHGGNLNVPYLLARLNEATFATLLDAGVIPADSAYNANTIYTIDLKPLKMTNRSYAKSKSAQEIVEELYEIGVMKARQYALNKVLKEVGAEEQYQPEELSFEEQEIRNRLRINFKGVYEPLKTEPVISDTVESYPATFVDWSIAKFPEKKLKEAAVAELEKELERFKGNNSEIFAYVTEMVTRLRKEIRSREMAISFVRMAAALSRRSPFQWQNTEVKDKKASSKITGNNLVVGGTCEKRSAVIDGKEIVETRWMQMIEV